jgi:hypothetical protein
MIPDHCKDVSLRDVDFDLTPENIATHVKGKRAYTRTDHMVLRNGKQLAVIEVTKKGGKELFRDIIAHRVISLPEDTVWLEDPELDILNPSELAKVAAANPGRTVVIEGVFNHITFVHELKALRLRVVDNVPPYPSKLSVLVSKALASGFVDLPIVTEVEDVDLNDYVGNVGTEAVMFPCKASGLRSDRKVFFLDDTPELDVECTLIGCHLSRRIFNSHYRRDVEAFINVCPWDLAPKDDVPTIVKCCKIKNGHRLEGNMAIVPWGATIRETAEAIIALFESLGVT